MNYLLQVELRKDEMMMQIYADVTNRDQNFRICSNPALGSAMFGAVAAGAEEGGYDSIVDAAKVMAKVGIMYISRFLKT